MVTFNKSCCRASRLSVMWNKWLGEKSSLNGLLEEKSTDNHVHVVTQSSDKRWQMPPRRSVVEPQWLHRCEWKPKLLMLSPTSLLVQTPRGVERPKRGQVCTWHPNRFRKGDRFTHGFEVSSEKGTGLHMILNYHLKKGQVCTWHPNKFRKGHRFTHGFEVSSEKGTGLHMILNWLNEQVKIPCVSICSS